MKGLKIEWIAIKFGMNYVWVFATAVEVDDGSTFSIVLSSIV